MTAISANAYTRADPGSCEDEASGVERIADAINRAVAEVPDVVCVLENMAGQGHHLGARFEQLAAIIARVSDKSRVGVCLDTCHLFGAGYDVRTASSFARVMDEFDRIVGARYLMAMHLNDSKCDLASKKYDAHAFMSPSFSTDARAGTGTKASARVSSGSSASASS